MDLAEWISRERKQRHMTLRTIADKANVSAAFLSQLENRKYVGKHGQPMRPSRETVIAIADALGADRNDALDAAGYAAEKPRTKEELFHALARLGVFEATFEPGALDNLSEEDFEELFDVITTHLNLELRRISRRRK